MLHSKVSDEGHFITDLICVWREQASCEEEIVGNQAPLGAALLPNQFI